MEHSFNIEIARMFGVNAAIILNNLYFWTEQNRANGRNLFDGRYWTYNSTKAFEVLFPYLTARQINYAIDKLEDARLIMRGNFNEKGFDRTSWYAITDFGYKMLDGATVDNSVYNSVENPDFPILQNCQMHLTNLSDAFDNNVKPIPYINTDINTDNTSEAENNGVGAGACNDLPCVDADTTQTDLEPEPEPAAPVSNETVVLGAYSNVRLPVAKYYALVGRYGIARSFGKIERLSDYLHRNPKMARLKFYDDHAAVLDKWLKEDAKGMNSG